jgi:uncharacterized RDD family membrane protein YckC
MPASHHAGAQPAGFWIRLVAVLIDSILVNVVFYGIVAVGGLASSPESGGPAAAAIALGIVLSLAYVIGFTGAKGATPGKMALGLRVVREDGGPQVGYGKAFMREIVGKLVSGVVLYVGFLVAGFRADKKGWHDMIAGTQVVRVSA